ncbi:uncharacterized protein LOC131854438 [Achroia grisella]|uniref:uncharacterized protein LOC131854438 n=1 Tax=Achroia grisella TaxID=688607 RepID=UPI0027D2E47F|nr:uncharacterized protein LOC131854438 [Achroia grisella]
MGKPKWNFRDISLGLQILREFLLGRKHNLHGRFPPKMAPRTIPSPDIPRGPDDKYSNQYYFKRNAFNSVKPPVVAPIAEGPSMNRDPTKKAMPGGVRPDAVCFSYLPSPGPAWWWDGHCYYECVPDPPPSPPPPCPPCSPPPEPKDCAPPPPPPPQPPCSP